MAYKFYAKKPPAGPGALEVGMTGLSGFAEGFVPAMVQAQAAKRLRLQQEQQMAFAQQKLAQEGQYKERDFGLRAQQEAGRGDRQSAQIAAAGETARLAREAAATNLGTKNTFAAGQQRQLLGHQTQMQLRGPGLQAAAAKQVGDVNLGLGANRAFSAQVGADTPFIGNNGPVLPPSNPAGLPVTVPPLPRAPGYKQTDAPGVLASRYAAADTANQVRGVRRSIGVGDNVEDQQILSAAKAAWAQDQSKDPRAIMRSFGLSETKIDQLIQKMGP